MSIVEEIKKIVPNKRIKSSVDLIKKFKKEDVEKEIQTLETSKDQEDFNLSIILAFALGDKDRVFKGFSHNATSAKKTSVQCLSILSDDQLETIIFNSVKSIRHAILKKVRKNRTNLLEKIILSLLEKFGKQEALVLVPFIKNKELVTKIVETSNLTKSKDLQNQVGYQKKQPKLLFELFKKEVEEQLKLNPTFMYQVWGNRLVKSLYKKFPKEMLKLERETSPNSRNFTFIAKSHPDILYELLKQDPSLSFEYGAMTASQIADIVEIAISKNVLTTFDALLNIKNSKKVLEILNKKIDLFEVLKDKKVNFSNQYTRKTLDLPLEFSDKYFSYKLEKSQSVTKKIERALLDFYKWFDYSKVKTQLEEMLKTKDAIFRSDVYSAIVFSGLRTPNEQKSVISLLEKKLKNEQDQVKLSVLISLKALLDDKSLLKNVEFFDKVLTPFLYGVDRSQEIYKELIYIASKFLQHQSQSKEHMDLCTKWYKEIIKQATVTSFTLYLKKETNQAFLLVLKDTFKEYVKRGNVFMITNYLIYNTPLTCEYIEMVLPRILQNDKKTIELFTHLVSLYLTDKKTRLERLKKVLELDPTSIALKPIQTLLFSSNQSLLEDYLKINGPITWESLKVEKGAFIQQTENYYFNPVIVKQFRTILPRQTKEKIYKLYTIGLKDEFIKPGMKSKMIITMANFQLGSLSDEFVKYIGELSNSKDQKIQQTAIASIQYSDLVNLEEIIKKMTPKNAKLLASSLSRMLLYSTQKEIDNFMKFLESDEFFKLQMTVQRELLNLLTQFPNQRSFDLIKKISKRENLEDNLKLILVFFATKFITQDPELWKIIDFVKSSEYLPLVQKVFKIPYSKNSLETNKKFVELQLEFLSSENLEIQKFAWGSIQKEYTNCDEFSNLCIQFLSEMNDEIPSDLIQIVINKLVGLIVLDEKVFQKIMKYLSSLKEIESKKDQPIRSIYIQFLTAFQSNFQSLLTHEKMVQEFHSFLLKSDPTLSMKVLQSKRNQSGWHSFTTQQYLDYFETVVDFEKQLSVKYPQFYFLMDQSIYYLNQACLEEVILKLFEKGTDNHVFLALKIYTYRGNKSINSVFEHIKKARKSSNIVISSLAKNTPLENDINGDRTPLFVGEWVN